MERPLLSSQAAAEAEADGNDNNDTDYDNRSNRLIINNEEESLLHALQREVPEAIRFLQATGILYPWAVIQEARSSYCYWIAFGVNLITLPYFFIISIVYFSEQHTSTKILVEYGILIDSLLFLQVAVLIPFLYRVVQSLTVPVSSSHFQSSYDVPQSQIPLINRLSHSLQSVYGQFEGESNSKVQILQNIEIKAYKTSLPTCFHFSLIFMLLLLLDLIFKIQLSIENKFRVNLLEYMSICCISATLLFVSADCRIGCMLIEHLQEEVQSKQLTITKLKYTRQEIERRVNNHAYTITWIVLVAVLNILYLLVIDIISTKWTSTELLELLPWKLASYFKEILFLMILFNESAKLNEQADKLREMVAEEDVDEEDMRGQIRRLSVLGSLTVKPISFPIAGRSWTKMDMLLQVITVTATTLIVVLRAIFLDRTF